MPATAATAAPWQVLSSRQGAHTRTLQGCATHSEKPWLGTAATHSLCSCYSAGASIRFRCRRGWQGCDIQSFRVASINGSFLQDEGMQEEGEAKAAALGFGRKILTPLAQPLSLQEV